MSGKVGRKKQLKTILKEKGLNDIHFIFNKWYRVKNQILLFGSDEDDKLELFNPHEIIELEGGMLYIDSTDTSASDFVLDTSMEVEKV